MANIHVKTTLVVAARNDKGEVIPGKTKEIPPGIYDAKGFPVTGADLKDLEQGGFVAPAPDSPKPVEG